MPWKFGISFGLVNIPCRIHTSAKEEKVSFNMITKDGNRVRQKLVDEVTGKDIKRNETKKGWEVSKGQYLVFEPDEIKNLKLKSTRTIDIIGFAPADFEKHPLYRLFQKAQFYVSPETGGEKGYSILYNALKELNITAVGKVVLSNGGKESIVVIAPWGKILLLTVLYYKQEIQNPPQVDMAEVSDRELELGKQLISALGKPDLEKLKDKYIEAVHQLVEARAKGETVAVGAIDVEQTTESDIAAALEKSLGSLGTEKKKKLGVAVSVQGTEEMVET